MPVVIVPILNARSPNLPVSPVGGLILPPDDATLSHRKLIVALAAKHALPAVYQFREFVKAGSLLCYGTNIVDVYRRGVSPLRTALETPSTAFTTPDAVEKCVLRSSISSTADAPTTSSWLLLSTPKARLTG
jgi:hypothetical protein